MKKKLLEELIKIIPGNLRSRVNKRDWDFLEYEVCLLLSELDKTFGGRWVNAAEDKNAKIIIQIASLSALLNELEEQSVITDLIYWCWQDHEAFEINQYVYLLYDSVDRLDFLNNFFAKPEEKEKEDLLHSKYTQPIWDNWERLYGVKITKKALEV